MSLNHSISKPLAHFSNQCASSFKPRPAPDAIQTWVPITIACVLGLALVILIPVGAVYLRRAYRAGSRHDLRLAQLGIASDKK